MHDYLCIGGRCRRECVRSHEGIQHPLTGSRALDRRSRTPDSGHPSPSVALADHLLDQPHDAAAELGVFQEHKRPGQGQAVRGGEKVVDVIRRVSLPFAAPSVWRDRVVEEKGNGHPQGAGYLLQSTGADPVSPLLIFLNLLEG
jgi:hypothetical protein